MKDSGQEKHKQSPEEPRQSSQGSVCEKGELGTLGTETQNRGRATDEETLLKMIPNQKITLRNSPREYNKKIGNKKDNIRIPRLFQ